MSSATEELKKYLTSELSLLINNNQFIQALPGHLNYSSESEMRKKIVEERMQEIIDLGK